MANNTSTKRNPTWSRDELILALEFYMRNRENPPRQTSPEIEKLSAELNAIGETLGHRNYEKYWNPNGTYMKLMNFRRFDPQYTGGGGVGLAHGSSGEEAVWNEFANDPERLQRAAEAIRENLASGGRLTTGANELSDHGDEEVAEAQEGQLVTRLHRNRERSRKLVQRKKASFEKQHGRLFCEACGFDPALTYSDRATSTIECHHTRPVHTLRAGAKTRLDDLGLAMCQLPSSGSRSLAVAKRG